MKKYDGSNPSGLSDEYENHQPLTSGFFDSDVTPIPLDEAFPLVDKFLYTLDDIDAEQARRDSIREALQPTYLNSDQTASSESDEKETQKDQTKETNKNRLSSPHLESDLVMDKNTKAILRRVSSELKERDHDINLLKVQLEAINNSLASVIKRKEEHSEMLSEIYTTLDEIQKSLLEFREEKDQSVELQSIDLKIEQLTCRCHDIEEKLYYPEYFSPFPIEKAVSELHSYQEDFRADLTEVETDVKNILNDIESLFRNKLDQGLLLEKNSSKLSELWQLARRTSREASEAKTCVWESQEAIKLKQAQEKQESRINSQSALIAEMRKRLDALETENKILRQEIKTKENTKPPQQTQTKKPAEKKLVFKEILLRSIISLFIVGILASILYQTKAEQRPNFFEMPMEKKKAFVKDINEQLDRDQPLPYEIKNGLTVVKHRFSLRGVMYYDIAFNLNKGKVSSILKQEKAQFISEVCNNKKYTDNFKDLVVYYAFSFYDKRKRPITTFTVSKETCESLK